MPTTTPQPPKPAGKFRRLPRLLALAAVCLAALGLALPFVARQMIGPERLKNIAAQTLSDALGRRVTIDGEVTVVFSPWLSLRMGPLTVADAPGFGHGPMLAVRRLEMTIRMLPLVRRIVSPGSVRVRDLTLFLRRDAAGRGNWEDLTAPTVATAPDAPGWEFAPQPGDVQVANASVEYRDAATGRSTAIRDVQLKTGHGQPVPFSLSLRAEGFVPGGSVECHAGGKVALDPDQGGLILKDTLLETALVLQRPLVAGGATPTRLVSRVAVTYDPATATLSLAGLDARLPGARLTGSASIREPLRAPKAQAALTVHLDMDGSWRDILGLTPAATPDNLIAAPDAPRDPLPVAPNDAKFAAEAPPSAAGRAVLRLAATAEAGRFDVDDFSLALPKGRITGKGTFLSGQTPRLDADLSAQDVDFDALPLPAGRSTWPWPLPWPTSGAFDAHLALHRCKLAGLAITDAQATGRGQEGLLRLAPVSLVLPQGVVSLDARFDAGLPPGNAADAAPPSLGLDIRAAVQPLAGEAAEAPSQARLLGRLRAEGAKGNLLAQSPDAARALEVLGLGGLVPSSGALDLKSAFAVAPGPNRLAAKATLTGLEAKFAGLSLRGQIGYDAAAAPDLDFDLALDNLDLDRLGSLAGLPAAGNAPSRDKARAEGKLRIERLTGRGVEARNIALGLNLAGGKLDAAVTGGELFGGKLTGKIDAEPSGKITGALQLTGAEARRLPGSLGLSGTLGAKAGVELALGGKGHPTTLAATVEADSPQLSAGRSGKGQALAGAKAALTVKGKRTGPEGFDGEASLVASLASGLGLRDLRLTAAGPVPLDASGRLRETLPLKIDASALARPAEAGKPVKVSLAGQATVDAGGGFAAPELRLDAGGLPATLKIAKNAGATAPTTFSLDTGPFSPRKVLADWSIALPAGLAADRLTKASAAASGTIVGEAWDIKRLALSVDDVNVVGSASLIGGDPKRGKWDLRVDRLDCDAYFPRLPASGPPPPSELRKPLDLRLLRELALEAKAQFGWFKKGNVVFDASTVTASAKGGQFTYRQESPRFYGGRFSAEIRGDARDTALKTLVELKLEGIEITRFLWDWAEGDTLDSGACTFILAARTSGENEEELRGNLAGNASLQVTRGSLKVREPAAAKNGEKPPVEKIPFDVFSSSWFAKGGVAHSDDFRIDSPRMRVAGKGFVDLRDETINLSLSASLAGGGDVPATIIGPLDGPKLTIDRSKLIGDVVYRLLQGIVSIPGKAVTRILQIR